MLKLDHSTFPVGVTNERLLDRRRFLGAAAATVALVTGGEWLARRLTGWVAAPPPLAPDAGADLAVGAARVLLRADGETLAVRLADGTVAAFDRRCPHLGCPVVWAAARERFECPCHDAAFDARTGRVLFGPPRTGLTPVAITTG